MKNESRTKGMGNLSESRITRITQMNGGLGWQVGRRVSQIQTPEVGQRTRIE